MRGKGEEYLPILGWHMAAFDTWHTEIKFFSGNVTHALCWVRLHAFFITFMGHDMWKLVTEIFHHK